MQGMIALQFAMLQLTSTVIGAYIEFLEFMQQNDLTAEIFMRCHFAGHRYEYFGGWQCSK